MQSGNEAQLNFEELLSRAQGALLGVAIGDGMGAPVEGMSADEIFERHGQISGFLSEEPVGTDDTDFTLFNAYLLAGYGEGISLEQVEWEWRDKLLGHGRAYRPGGFSDVISTRNLRDGLHAPYSGEFNHQMWSDGVAMAISPAGILAAGKPELAAHLAQRLGSVSNGRDGIYAAMSVAAAVAAAMSGATPAQMLDAAIQVLPQDTWTGRCLVRLRQHSHAWNGDLQARLHTISREFTIQWWPWADLVTEAVPLAFGAFLAADGQFEQAVPGGVSLGRDADTIGAIVGGLAGAYCGLEAIPAGWLKRIQRSSGRCIGFVRQLDPLELARRLVERRLEMEAR